MNGGASMSGATAAEHSSTGGGRRLTADARRRQLFEVALSLFAAHGYPATTMDDIAEAAGVTKPLVYQHFESKRALYLELMDVFSTELVTRIVKATAGAEGPRQQVEQGFAAYFELMVENEPAFRLLYGRDAPDDPELASTGAPASTLASDPVAAPSDVSPPSKTGPRPAPPEPGHAASAASGRSAASAGSPFEFMPCLLRVRSFAETAPARPPRCSARTPAERARRSRGSPASRRAAR